MILSKYVSEPTAFTLQRNYERMTCEAPSRPPRSRSLYIRTNMQVQVYWRLLDGHSNHYLGSSWDYLGQGAQTPGEWNW